MSIKSRNLRSVIALAAVMSSLCSAAADSCPDNLHALTREQQISCVDPGRLGQVPTYRLIDLISSSDGTTDHRVIAGLLEQIRSRVKTDAALTERLALMLSHQSAMYENRDKWQVIRLRSYVFATLADIGFPDSAMPMLADTLSFIDERMAAVEIGGAIRVAGKLGEDGRQFLPSMLRAISQRFSEEEFSLLRYAVDFPREEATTVQLEVMRTVEAIGLASDVELLTVLRSIASSSPQSGLDPRFVAAAGEALQVVENRDSLYSHHDPHPQSGQPDEQERLNLISTWLPPEERRLLEHLDVHIIDQEGNEHLMADLLDRPLLLTFFYTRCQNAGKCSMSVSRLAFLQQALQSEELALDVRLLALTFEPAYDTPDRLKRFVQTRGLKLNQGALCGHVDEAHHESLIRDLGIPVSFSAGWVNTHGVESILIDMEGRLARKYLAAAWDSKIIIDDIRALLAEG